MPGLSVPSHVTNTLLPWLPDHTGRFAFCPQFKCIYCVTVIVGRCGMALVASIGYNVTQAKVNINGEERCWGLVLGDISEKVYVQKGLRLVPVLWWCQHRWQVHNTGSHATQPCHLLLTYMSVININPYKAARKQLAFQGTKRLSRVRRECRKFPKRGGKHSL